MIKIKKLLFFFIFFLFFDSWGVFCLNNLKPNEEFNFKKISDFIEIFKKNSFSNLSDEEISEKMISGFLKEVDQYGDFFINSHEYKTFNQKLRSNYNGVGVFIEKINNLFKVTSIEKDSIASKAGLQIDDVIMSVNGEIPKKPGPLECEIDKNLSLFVWRNESGIKEENDLNDATKKFEILLSCHNLKQKNIEFSLINQETGLLKIHSFAEGISKDFDLISKSNFPQNLIIDLRNNGGGLREEAFKLLLNFFDSRVLLFSIKDKNNKIVSKFESIPEFSLKNISNMNIVILVNKNSASASEIFASALGENGKAIIVGKKTFGKGVGQSLFEVEDNKFLKITTSLFLTPKGNEIEGVGIIPDIEINDNFQMENLFTKYKISCTENSLNSIHSSENSQFENDFELYIANKILSFKSKCIFY